MLYIFLKRKNSKDYGTSIIFICLTFKGYATIFLLNLFILIRTSTVSKFLKIWEPSGGQQLYLKEIVSIAK